MGKFSYGGFGDGTNWSSERGSGPQVSEIGGNSGSGRNRSTAPNSQIAAIRKDKNMMEKISKVMQTAHNINPAVAATVIRLPPEGVMVVSLEGLNAEQGKQAGLTGLVMGFTGGVVGDINTGYKSLVVNNEKKYATENGNSLDSFTSTGKVINTIRTFKNWASGDEKTYFFSGGMPVGIIHHVTVTSVNNVDTYTLYYKDKKNTPQFTVVLTNGDLNSMQVKPIGSPTFTDKNARLVVGSLAPVRAEAERDILLKVSEIIVSAGDKAGSYLGDKYKILSREIASNIQNMQGKKIRNYDQAMSSIDKLMANPNMQINAADKAVIINAWQSFNADDMGNKFATLGKTFKVADYALKAKSVKERSIEGYKTGNWGPLMREVESWIVSGLTSGVALGVISAVLGSMLMWAGIPATAVTVVAIILAGIVGSFIDDKFIERLNNEIIRPAH